MDGSLNILNINVRFVVAPSPSVGEFFLQGRVRVTTPFLFQYTSTSLSFLACEQAFGPFPCYFFPKQRASSQATLFLRFSQRGVHARAPDCVNKSRDMSRDHFAKNLK